MKPNAAIVLSLAILTVPVSVLAADNKTVTQSVKETANDAAITTKIKAEYAKDKDVSVMNIKVDTDYKGIVTLSGNAKSQMEADKAVTLAKNVSGVTSVTNNIKVQPK
jgi:hyperosmotically inducible protein